MFCPKCGSKNVPDSRFCRSCGVELELSGYEENLRENNNLKSIGHGEVKLASLGSRIGAYLIDVVVYGLLCLGVGFVIGVVFLIMGNTLTLSEDISTLLAIIVLFAYFIPLEGPLGRGRTIGKMALKLRVVSEKDQSMIGYGASSVRNILMIIDSLFFYLIGIILISSSDLNQRLGDRVAHTIVIKEG